MKNTLTGFIVAAAVATLPLTMDTAVAQEAATPVVAGSAEDHLALFRASLRIDKRDFIKQAMELDEEQGKKFWGLYHQYEADLMKLNDKRLEVIKDFAASLNGMTDAKADELVKRSLDFRKARTSLLEKYYGKIGKATSKVVAARFMQVEGVLQGAGDVVVGTSIPLMPKMQ